MHPRYTETLPDGSLLELHGDCMKPSIVSTDGVVREYGVAFKYYYELCEGIVNQKSRSDSVCIKLARGWVKEVV